ncbi:MAG: hypothetical protein QNK44_07900 [Hyphomicrobiaceae bacterium]|nr:hypothetical protein [Hyphomicrobiaceae bacterium]
MKTETLYALLQLIRFGTDTIEAYSKGEMTEEEIATAYADLQVRLAESNAMWESAGQ